MSSLSGAIGHLYKLDEMARQKTWIHQLHPATKLLVTILFLVTVSSFARDEISSLLPLLLYPVLIFALAEIPVWPIFKRLLLVEPFVIGIGLLNPILDRQAFLLGSVAISHGWLTLLSILLKTALTVTAALLLIATTGMHPMAAAMRLFKMPRLMVTLVLLIYRYLSVLAGEASRTIRAYALRSPLSPGIRPAVWGSLAGQLLLRSFDRAERLYQAMILRGFCGDYFIGISKRPAGKDFLYLSGWFLYFCLVRFFDLPAAVGALITGGLL